MVLISTLILVLSMLPWQAQTVPSPEPPPQASAVLTAMLPELAAEPGVVIVGYPVRGGSARLVRQSMNEVRPSSAAGERFDGLTTWRYAARWMRSADGDCDPASAEVSVSIVVTLPELETTERLSRQDRANWDRYLRALAAHEHNHVRLARAGAEQMSTYMRGAPDCATMVAARTQIGDAVREASRTYDATTRHGATEGATYP